MATSSINAPRYSRSYDECAETHFANHGLPEVIVSDNGSPFTAEEFKHFCKINGLCHLRTSPFHPASNDAAERAVALVKAGLSELATDTITAGPAQHRGKDLLHRLDRFSLGYRRTPVNNWHRTS